MSGASCKNCNSLVTRLNAQALEKALTESATKRFPIIVWKPFKRRDYNCQLESMWTEEHQEQHNTKEQDDKHQISAQHKGKTPTTDNTRQNTKRASTIKNPLRPFVVC